MCKTEVIKFPQTEMISLCFLFWKRLILTLTSRLQLPPCWASLRLPSPWRQAWVSSFTQTLPGSPSERLFSLPHLNHLLTVPACEKVEALVAQSCPALATPWTLARQAPLSMDFSKQEYWSGLPFPSSRIFLTQGLNLGLLYCRWTLYHLSHQGFFCLHSYLFFTWSMFPC